MSQPTFVLSCSFVVCSWTAATTRSYVRTYTTDEIPHYILNQRLGRLSPSLYVAVLLSCSRLQLTPPRFTPPQFAIHPLTTSRFPPFTLHSYLHTTSHHFTPNHPPLPLPLPLPSPLPSAVHCGSLAEPCVLPSLLRLWPSMTCCTSPDTHTQGGRRASHEPDAAKQVM